MRSKTACPCGLVAFLDSRHVFVNKGATPHRHSHLILHTEAKRSSTLRRFNMPSYDKATRAQALTLKILGVSNAEIERVTGMQTRSLNSLLKRAIERGFDPQTSPKILDAYVEDGKRSGRPKKQIEEAI